MAVFHPKLQSLKFALLYLPFVKYEASASLRLLCLMLLLMAFIKKRNLKVLKKTFCKKKIYICIYRPDFYCILFPLRVQQWRQWKRPTEPRESRADSLSSAAWRRHVAALPVWAMITKQIEDICCVPSQRSAPDPVIEKQQALLAIHPKTKCVCCINLWVYSISRPASVLKKRKTGAYKLKLPKVSSLTPRFWYLKG